MRRNLLKKSLVIFSFMLSFILITHHGRSLAQQENVAGVIFEEDVSRGNYFFVLKIVLSYRTVWGNIPSDREQLDKRIWDELTLSYEAHRRGITAEKGEIDAKIKQIMKDKKATIDRKADSKAYGQWVKENFRVPIFVFENQIQHLVQLKKLHDQVKDSINPTVTEDEVMEKFLLEQNNLSVELAEFEELKSAQEFYAMVIKDPEHWEQASQKDKTYIHEDRSFRTPGLVTLEFLTELWKFPKKAVFDMIAMKPGEFYPPAPIYEGYGVFKVLEIRKADDSKFPERKESYVDRLKLKKRFEGAQEWLKKLREDAGVQVFIEPPHDLFP